MRVVGREEIEACIDHDAAYTAVELALEAIAADAIDAPDELALSLRRGGEVHIKGAWLNARPHVVFKVASGGFPGAASGGCSILLDAETGNPTVLLDDGGWLTDMRTAAAGAVATDLLAVEGPLRVAILGTGTQAQFQLSALRQRREVTSVRVWGRNAARCEAFANDTSAVACHSVDDAVQDADVIVTTTSAREPVLFARHLRPGVHVTAIGADMVGKRELAADVLDAATVIVADDIETCARVGELQHSTHHLGRTVALADLFAQRELPSKRNADDLTVADLCGLGAYDAALASLAIDHVLDNELSVDGGRSE